MSEHAENPFVALKAGSALELDANERYPQAGHLWSQAEIDALIFAWAARRPLLVRGEAGSGKSQIARAAAKTLGSHPPLVEVIHPRFEALELLYRVDSVARLADAQVKKLDASNQKYVKRGRLWEAFAKARDDGAIPVLLIDEIDKADADLPNALLEVLGNRSFTVPPLKDCVVSAEHGRLPLVIITTNEERELPPAFVRRCAVLNLNPPEDNEAQFVDWLIARGRVHCHLDIVETARRHAADQVFADRKTAITANYPPVGLAEYIDLLTAVDELTRAMPRHERSAMQIQWMDRLGAYALVKNATSARIARPRSCPPTGQRKLMSFREPARALGATCRADLLRLLATTPRDALMLDRDASGWFGYVRRPQPPPQITLTQDAPSVEPGAKPGQARKPPLRLSFVPAIVRREPRQTPAHDATTEESFAPAAPIDQAAARAPSDKRLIAYENLLPPARLMPALRRLLGAYRTGPLDVERLTALLAAGQLPPRLPCRRYRRWHADLVVLLDFCPRLWPYRWDMHRLAERLLRHVGRSGVSLRIVNHGPTGPWSDWQAHQNRQTAVAPVERAWRMPPAGTPVLIVSDFGLLLGLHSATAKTWAQFVRDLIRAQVRPLAPLGAGQLGEPVPPSLPVLRWSPDARPRPTRVRGTAAAEPDGLDDLLAMVAATRRVDPPLLRVMRRLNPRAPLNAGLEGALWCHADVEAVHSASIRPEAAESHLRHFAERLSHLHTGLDRERTRHHAHLRAVLNHEETLLWRAQVSDEALARSPGAAQRVEQTRNFMRRLAATLTQPERPLSLNWWSVAQGIVRRADRRMWQCYSDELHRLLAPQLRAQGALPPIPKHADPAALARLLPYRPTVSCWLGQDAASGYLLLQAEPAGTRQCPLGEALRIDAGGVGVSVVGVGRRWLSADALPTRLAPLNGLVELHLETARESVQVGAIRRPLGALGWGSTREGIAVESPWLGSWQMTWSESMLRASPPREEVQAVSPRWALQADPVTHPDSQGTLQFGIEPRFGIYLDLMIATQHGKASQRLRWIEPGAFLMGSPETEAGRYQNEGPQHAVTLSEGFWLFDTPCTQALWQAVMGGDNPSYFKSPDRPVEQVSWGDVQKFLKRISILVPGLHLVLPSEAQWEYACRAGTETALYTGDLTILGDANAPALDPIAWYAGNSGVDFDLANGVDSTGWAEKQYPHTRAGTPPGWPEGTECMGSV